MSQPSISQKSVLSIGNNQYNQHQGGRDREALSVEQQGSLGKIISTERIPIWRGAIEPPACQPDDSWQMCVFYLIIILYLFLDFLELCLFLCTKTPKQFPLSVKNNWQ